MSVSKWVLTVSAAVMLGLTATAETLAQSPSEPTTVFQGILDFFRNDDAEDRRRGSAGGSRPAISSTSYCVVNPGKNDRLWSVQPLFVLQQGETEQVEAIAVRPAGELDPIWSVPVTPTESGEFQIRYDGPPLQPGTDYEWLFYTTFWGETYIDFTLPFQVMAEGSERDRITAELAQLQTELEATDADDSKQAIAAYFSENNLMADALQALFSIVSPSEDLLATRENLITAICSQPLTP